MIACMYQINHVSMSTDKLLKRIISPDIRENFATNEERFVHLYETTYEINADPLVHFAIIFWH